MDPGYSLFTAYCGLIQEILWASQIMESLQNTQKKYKCKSERLFPSILMATRFILLLRYLLLTLIFDFPRCHIWKGLLYTRYSCKICATNKNLTWFPLIIQGCLPNVGWLTVFPFVVTQHTGCSNLLESTWIKKIHFYEHWPLRLQVNSSSPLRLSFSLIRKILKSK